MGLFSSIFGGSESKSSPSTVWGSQAPYLEGLFKRAYSASLGLGSGGTMVGAGGGRGGGGGGGIPGLIGAVFGRGGRRFPGPVTGGGGAGAGGAATYQDPLQALGERLTGAAGGFLGNLQTLGTAGNPFAVGQIDQFGRSLGRFFGESILPGIAGEFAGSGTLGGSRQALSVGQAAGQLGDTFASGALGILGDSASLALDASKAGLAGAGDVFNLGNAATFGSLPGLLSLLGQPAILGGGSQASSTPGVLGGIGNLLWGGA